MSWMAREVLWRASAMDVSSTAPPAVRAAPGPHSGSAKPSPRTLGTLLFSNRTERVTLRRNPTVAPLSPSARRSPQTSSNSGRQAFRFKACDGGDWRLWFLLITQGFEDSRIQLKRWIFSSSADTMSDLGAEGDFSTSYFV